MSVQTKTVLLWTMMFFAFVIEGSVVAWLFPGQWDNRIAPHFVLIFVLLIALFLHRHHALTAGLVFGFLHDILYYGHMIGLHTFAMGLIGYLCGMSLQRKFMTFFYILLVCGIGIFVYDVIVYFIYVLFRLVSVPFEWALVQYMLPGLIFNLFFVTLLYVPMRQFLESMLPEKAEEPGNQREAPVKDFK